jgi:hypothetical protein
MSRHSNTRAFARAASASSGETLDQRHLGRAGTHIIRGRRAVVRAEIEHARAPDQRSDHVAVEDVPSARAAVGHREATDGDTRPEVDRRVVLEPSRRQLVTHLVQKIAHQNLSKEPHAEALVGGDAVAIAFDLKAYTPATKHTHTRQRGKADFPAAPNPHVVKA